MHHRMQIQQKTPLQSIMRPRQHLPVQGAAELAVEMTAEMNAELAGPAITTTKTWLASTLRLHLFRKLHICLQMSRAQPALHSLCRV